MWQRLALIALLAISVRAQADDYTDIWGTAGEGGWGINLVQSQDFIFATFFVYGPDNQPTWFTAQMMRNADGVTFSGPMYVTTGTYYPLPWDFHQHGIGSVGVATFAPTSADHGVLSYNVFGTLVTKNILRATSTMVDFTGMYRGAVARDVAQCNVPELNGSFSVSSDFDVTQFETGDVQIDFTLEDGTPCRISGLLQQTGKLYRIANAAYVCGGVPNTANVYEMTLTSLGFEGRWSASTGYNCQESSRFSGLFIPPPPPPEPPIP